MYFINVKILGSQCAHGTNDLVCYVGLEVMLTYIINFIIYKSVKYISC